MKNKQSIYIGVGFLTLGLLIGWLLFGGGDSTTAEGPARAETSEHTHEAGEVWTCSMHPQVRKDAAGQCPICGMDLIPVNISEAQSPEGHVQMTPAAMQIANVQTVAVQPATPTKELYLSGRVVADERNMAEITARFAGRIEQLYVNVTGQQVKRGQALASVYSPELVTAQQELVEAARFRDTNPSFYESAVNKLKRWDLSDRQIQNMLEGQDTRYTFNILAPQSGTVVSRNVTAGDYVQEGQSLFEVANLNQVWVVFDAYESDLPWVQEGDEIDFTVQSQPGQTFTSEVTFIDPVINPQKRVAEVRTEVKNQQGQLKPQMFAQGVLRSELPNGEGALAIPKSAVLWTGKRAVVYVKQPDAEQPTFAYREVVLGPEAGGQYLVSEGLQAGEEVVANGVFKVDAAAQLRGTTSMMSPPDEAGSITSSSPEHHHENMNESGSDESRSGESRSDHGETSPPSDSEVDPTFARQLSAMLDPYLKLKNSLVASDAAQAATAARQAQQSLQAIDMTLVSDEAHQQWMDYHQTMQETLATIEGSTELEAQRTAFAPLSQTLYQSIQRFGITGINAYYQYCPMADSNEGAYWLSQQEEINNPYFGEAMLRCGETREVLE